jgi:hypothetical protein
MGEPDGSRNQRVYITGFPTDATEDEVRELFSGIGVIGRVRQKRGYKDQVRDFPRPLLSRRTACELKLVENTGMLCAWAG